MESRVKKAIATAIVGFGLIGLTSGAYAWQWQKNGTPKSEEDAAQKVAIDPVTGNVFSLSTKQVGWNRHQMCLIKLTPDRLTVIWSDCVEGTAPTQHGVNVGSALVIDPVGRVFYGGTLYNIGGGQDGFLRMVDGRAPALPGKMPPENGWQRIFEGGGEYTEDRVLALALGYDNTIYVTGFLTKEGSQSIFLAKVYAPTGADWLWPLQTFAGLVNENRWADKGTVLLVRPEDGNPIVVGNVTTTNGDSDIVVATFSQTTGAVISSVYAGNFYDDFVTSAKYASDGQIIIGGIIQHFLDIPQTLVFSISSTSGVIGWRWNGGDEKHLWEGVNSIAHAIELDSAGNVAVTGAVDVEVYIDGVPSSYAHHPFIAYINGKDGATIWEDLRSGSSNEVIRGGSAVAFLPNRIVAVVTTETPNHLTAFQVIWFDLQGNKKRVKDVHGNVPLHNTGSDMAIGPDGTFVVVGSIQRELTSHDGVIVLLLFDGSEIARKTINGLGKTPWRRDEVYASAVNPLTGEFVLAGAMENFGDGVLGLVREFTVTFLNLANGSLKCQYTMDDVKPHLYNAATAVAVHGEYTFAAGRTRAASNGASSLTAVKLGPDCEEIWRKVLPPSVGDEATSLAIGPNGDPIVSGSRGGKFFTTRLDNETGEIKWPADLSALSLGGVKALVLTPRGTIVAAGWTGTGLSMKPTIVEYDYNTGAELFRPVFTGLGEVMAVAVGKNNTIVATGVDLTGDVFAGKILVAKLRLPSPGLAGKVLLKKTLPGVGDNYARSVAVDMTNDNIVIGGITEDAESNQLFTVLHLNGAGRELWRSNDKVGGVKAVRFGPTGDVFAVGETANDEGRSFAVRAFNGDGTEKWFREFAKPWTWESSAVTLHVRPDGLFAAGTIDTPHNGLDMFAVGLNVETGGRLQ